MQTDLNTISLAQRPDLFDEQNQIGANAWTEFMLHDPVAIEYWAQLIDAFSQYQLMVLDNKEIVAVINSVPLRFDKSFEALPEGGAEWGIVKSINDFVDKQTPNCLMAIQIVVPQAHQGKGLSKIATKKLIDLAGELDIDSVIVPLRPSEKQQYPLIPLKDYIRWQNEDGLPFDPWLRVHIKLGAELFHICGKSMQITGTIEQWESWTQLRFPGTGEYVIPGAICPLIIDTHKNQGCYTEPNIWLVHHISGKP